MACIYAYTVHNQHILIRFFKLCSIKEDDVLLKAHIGNGVLLKVKPCKLFYSYKYNHLWDHGILCNWPLNKNKINKNKFF